MTRNNIGKLYFTNNGRPYSDKSACDNQGSICQILAGGSNIPLFLPLSSPPLPSPPLPFPFPSPPLEVGPLYYG